MKDEGYSDNLKYRAQHGNLTLRKVKSGISGRVTAVGVEDGVHAALRNSLEKHGVYEAAMSLRLGFEAITRGLGCKISNPEAIGRTSKGGTITENGAALYADYCRWYKECERLHLAPKLCVNVICHDYSARHLDAEYALRKGTTMDRVIAALKIYQNCK